MNLNKKIIVLLLALSPFLVHAHIWSDTKNWVKNHKVNIAASAYVLTPLLIGLSSNNNIIRSTGFGIFFFNLGGLLGGMSGMIYGMEKGHKFCFNFGGALGGLAGVVYGVEKGIQIGKAEEKLIESSKKFAHDILHFPHSNHKEANKN